jgi:hypothetical protein
MSDEIAKLKAELEALNLQCQLARDHEIRYALQRTRLETARMQMMLKIVDAFASSTDSTPAATVQPLAKPLPDAVRTVTIPAKPAAHTVKLRQKRKPDGLPSVPDMVLTVLENGADEKPKGMKPREIAAIIRKMWWPDVPMPAVGAAAWTLAGKGRLENHGGFYKLNAESRLT